jgi:hypothetical protein
MRLKEGTPIMLLRNLDPTQGLANGIRLVVVRCQPRVIEAMTVGGRHNGKHVFLPRTCQVDHI